MLAVAVESAFPADGEAVTTAAQLSEAQRLALELAASRPYRSQWTADLYANAGCPRQPEAIRVFLGLDEPRALDTQVELDGESVPLWRALSAVLRQAVRNEVALSTSAPAIAAQLAPAVCIAAIEELLGQNYHYPDIAVRVGPVSEFGSGEPHIQQSKEWSAELVAEFLAPCGEAARGFCEDQLAALEGRPVGVLQAVPTLVLLSRLGGLDHRWDQLLARCLLVAPRSRCPKLVGEVVVGLPIDRAVALFHDVQPDVMEKIHRELEAQPSLDQARVAALRLGC